MKTPKIWGIGLGRTGTKSLCKALNILQYNVVHNPPDLDSISSPYIDGSAEGTTAFHFKYLDLRFPESKFILTTRELFSWLSSCENAINHLYPSSRFDTNSKFYNYMIRNRSNRYGSLKYDKSKLVEKYYEHHRDVIQHFKGSAHKLLIIDLTSSNNPWDELCDFLECPIPPTNFPSIKD